MDRSPYSRKRPFAPQAPAQELMMLLSGEKSAPVSMGLDRAELRGSKARDSRKPGAAP